jgi:hypothetical protein
VEHSFDLLAWLGCVVGNEWIWPLLQPIGNGYCPMAIRKQVLSSLIFARDSLPGVGFQLDLRMPNTRCVFGFLSSELQLNLVFNCSILDFNPM